VGIGDSTTSQQLPFPYDRVFDSLVAVLPALGFSLKTKDRLIGRLTASAGMSVLSYGESVSVQVQRSGDDATTIVVQSNLRVGVNLTAAGKNAQNAERIIAGVSDYLQRDGRPRTPVATALTQADISAPSLRVMVAGGVVVFSLVTLAVLLMGR
jgi:hypothetical protein